MIRLKISIDLEGEDFKRHGRPNVTAAVLHDLANLVFPLPALHPGYELAISDLGGRLIGWAKVVKEEDA